MLDNAKDKLFHPFLIKVLDLLRSLVSNKPRISKIIFLCLIFSIVPFLILTMFANPAYDDICFLSSTLEFGPYQMQLNHYNRWSGRYFSTALISIAPMSFGDFQGYKIIAFFIISLTFFAIFCFISAFLSDTENSLIDKLIISTFITALYSNQMPDITEGYYWLSGSVTYQIPSILTLFFFVIIIKLFESRKFIIRNTLLAFCYFLVFAIVGSSEISMLALILLLGFITVKSYLMKSKKRWIWTSLLVFAILCSVIVLAAPGNEVRSTFFPNRQRLIYSTFMGFGNEVRFLLTWFSNSAFILGTIVFIPIAYRINKNNLLNVVTKVHPFSSSFLLLAIVFIGFFGPFWSTGLLGQLRSVNAVYFLFLIGWFVNIFIWVDYFREKISSAVESFPKYAYFICVPLIVISLFATNNNKDAIEDLMSKRAFKYEKQAKLKRNQIESCVREKIKRCKTIKIETDAKTLTNNYFSKEPPCGSRYWQLKLNPPNK